MTSYSAVQYYSAGDLVCSLLISLRIIFVKNQVFPALKSTMNNIGTGLDDFYYKNKNFRLLLSLHVSSRGLQDSIAFLSRASDRFSASLIPSVTEYFKFYYTVEAIRIYYILL